MYSMSHSTVSEACFLCGSASEYYEYDAGKRRHYRCTGANCGEYVVTDTVRERLNVPHARHFKLQAAALAKRASRDQEVLEIWVNPSTRVLETHLVPIVPIAHSDRQAARA